MQLKLFQFSIKLVGMSICLEMLPHNTVLRQQIKKKSNNIFATSLIRINCQINNNDLISS